MATLETFFCSSLTKILPGRKPENTILCGEALRGERFSFQLVFKCSEPREFIRVKADSPFGNRLTVRETVWVPVNYMGFDCDDNVESALPGLFPDLLAPLPPDGWLCATPQWKSVWITVDIPRNAAPGKHKISFTITQRNVLINRDLIQSEQQIEFPLEVINALLPPQKLINTHWFHCDCLADYYNVPVFSEKHWQIIANFMKNAAAHGINMILTPIFTPPLDTLEGTQRPTVQLVDISCRNGKYSFGFKKLERWITLAEKCGIKYFEMAHLFTQWGAAYTPGIVVKTDGRKKRVFGWEKAADSPEYIRFLDAFLPALTDFFKQKKMTDKVYFHCSDEPGDDHFDLYSKNQKLLSKYLKGFKIIDALSHPDYFTSGVISTPIPVESKLEDFIAAGMKERWTYYCCAPERIYCNRFIHMKSARNRIFGSLLYKYKVRGFLHWGFNFYYASLSRYLIDPYRNCTSGSAFPPGDGFLVYPGKNGLPEDSIRHEVFFEGLQDQRALLLLEKRIGREQVEQILDSFAPAGCLKMDSYPAGEKQVLALRSKINQLIRENCC